MICFFPYLITFQSLQRNISIRPRTYLQAPLMIPAQAGDYIGKLTGTGTASCHKIPARSTSFIQNSDMRRCPAGVGWMPSHIQYVSREEGSSRKRISNISSYGKYTALYSTAIRFTMRARVCTRLSRKANPSDSFGSAQHQLQIGVGT